MDRPLWSSHPKHGYIYPVNYGYISDTVWWDGDELDIYVLWVHKPVDHIDDIRIIAYIHRADDVEYKLVWAPLGKTYTASQIEALVEFQEQRFASTVILPVS
jgi:inorganic pyrophosphatase